MFNVCHVYTCWRLVKKSIWLCMFISLIQAKIFAMPTSVGENEVKAVFLFNFSLFTTWPNTAFSTRASSFNLCVLDNDDFKEQLQIAVEGEHVDERNLRISNITNYQHTKNCHILFVSRSQEYQLDAILTHIKSSPVLTVSDIEDFVSRGGMIEFYLLQNRVRFMIDPATIEEAGLKISSRLLNIAKIVSKK